MTNIPATILILINCLTALAGLTVWEVTGRLGVAVSAVVGSHVALQTLASAYTERHPAQQAQERLAPDYRLTRRSGS